MRVISCRPTGSVRASMSSSCSWVVAAAFGPLSRDRKVREEAFRAMFGAYRQFEDTFAALYCGAVKTDNFRATVRGYSSACEAALDHGNVPVSVYDSLIEAVHESLPAMKKYLKLRKKHELVIAVVYAVASLAFLVAWILQLAK